MVPYAGCWACKKSVFLFYFGSSFQNAWLLHPSSMFLFHQGSLSGTAPLAQDMWTFSAWRRWLGLSRWYIGCISSRWVHSNRIMSSNPNNRGFSSSSAFYRRPDIYYTWRRPKMSYINFAGTPFAFLLDGKKSVKMWGISEMKIWTFFTMNLLWK